MNADEQARMYWIRRDLAKAGYAVTYQHHGALTEADVRAATDAMLCEKPGLNAVAMRWDGRYERG